jgi:NAD(P)-dependent dehydrogenase (short-subunit alcohol dehydrogenase family)
LGAAIAIELATRGADVCINYRNSASEAQEVARVCSSHGVRAIVVRGDVQADEDCRRLVAEAVAAFGGLDVLVNNAGITKFAPHEDLSLLDKADFLKLYEANVVSMFQMTRAASSHLGSDRIGAIVNVSSIAGVTGIGSSIAYAATKGAVNTMTLSLARALAPRIRINAICPGYIDTNWFARHLGEEAKAQAARRAAQRAPLEVASTPADVAASAVFLAGPDSRHITGETLLVDAGLHLGFAPLVGR